MARTCSGECGSAPWTHHGSDGSWVTCVSSHGSWITWVMRHGSRIMGHVGHVGHELVYWWVMGHVSQMGHGSSGSCVTSRGSRGSHMSWTSLLMGHVGQLGPMARSEAARREPSADRNRLGRRWAARRPSGPSDTPDLSLSCHQTRRQPQPQPHAIQSVN